MIDVGPLRRMHICGATDLFLWYQVSQVQWERNAEIAEEGTQRTPMGTKMGSK